MIRELLTLVLVLTLTVGVTSAQQTESSVSIDIKVQQDGDAVWTITNEIPLDTNNERRAFDKLMDNQTRLNQLETDTVERFRNFGDQASQQVDRSMSIERESVVATKNGDTGRITVKFTWTNFAESANGKVVVGDIFRGGFSLSEGQSLSIEGPYRKIQISGGGEVRGSSAVWKGPVDIDENVTIKFTPTGTPGESLPGLGVAGALLALIALAVLARS